MFESRIRVPHHTNLNRWHRFPRDWRDVSRPLPIVAIMLVAVATTKILISLDRGFWVMAHEARTDYLMLLGATFVSFMRAGPWSVESKLTARTAGGVARTLKGGWSPW